MDFEVNKFQNDPVLVLSGINWHEGVIGIVASRIKEKYNKPTILISLDNNLGKGSGRSIFGFDIGTLIINATHSGILEKGGGHKMAGGFTIKKENIPLFKACCLYADNQSLKPTESESAKTKFVSTILKKINKVIILKKGNINFFTI